VQTTAVPRFKFITFIENFGGFATLVWGIAKFFVAFIEVRLVESSLIRQFY
jgi:hypothetical protein